MNMQRLNIWLIFLNRYGSHQWSIWMAGGIIIDEMTALCPLIYKTEFFEIP